MAYVPQNVQAFISAFSGALAGAALDDRDPSSQNSADYAAAVNAIGAFAQEFDTLRGPIPANSYDLDAILKCCQGVFMNRSALSIVNADYAALARAVLAVIQAGAAYLAAQGIIPPSGGGGSVETTFVYQPGGVAKDNVFTSWTALYAAYQLVEGPKIIQVDPTFTPVPLIPAGTYDLFNGTLAGNISRPNGADPIVCELADGVVFQNLGHITNQLVLSSLSTSVSVYTPPLTASANLLLLDNGGGFTNGVGSTVPFIHIQNGSALIIAMLIGGNVGTMTATDCVQLDAGGGFLTVLSDLASLSNDCVVGAGNMQILVASQGAFVNTPFPITQVGLTTPPVTMVFSFADRTNITVNGANWVAPPPTDVQAAVNRLAALVDVLNDGPIPLSGGFRAFETTFIYQQGGTAGKNVYTSWAALYADASQVKGPKSIKIDTTFANPSTIPAGTYDMTDISLNGGSSVNVNAVCNLPDGVVFQNLASVDNGLKLVSFATTTPVITVSGQYVLLLENGAAITNDVTSTQPFIDVPAGQVLSVILTENSILGTNTINTIRTAAGSSTFILGADYVGIKNDIIAGAGNVAVEASSQSVFANSTNPITQAGVTGVYLFRLWSDAAQEVYTAASAVNWNGTPPTNVKDALDRIASAIGPIP